MFACGGSLFFLTDQLQEPIIRGTQQRFPLKFIENTFQAIQSIFRSLEMHCKRRYKICIFSVILGELESFRNYQGLSIVFSKILDAVLSFTKVRICLIPLPIAFSVSFFLRKQPNLGTEMRRFELQKIVGNLLHMLRKLNMNGTVNQKFLAFLKLQKILGNFCFSEKKYRKQSFRVSLRYGLLLITNKLKKYSRTPSVTRTRIT